ncbi:MAG TPA: toll/interleukin-1 receptor domain-containing protein [Pyrinomonadaceae bacterium]|nr:toll/interleukin-1 receptor domain-containing protein [Pyrinomonadaceae bacterium]
MSSPDPAFRVFISHSSVDTWVALQIARAVEACGAAYFLDEADMEYGDDFEDKILAAVRASQELLVLLTPWAIKRPYIWLEMGAVWGQGQRIVGVLYGLGVKELMTDEGTPALLKRITLVEINKLDEYFDQLAARVEKARQDNG